MNKCISFAERLYDRIAHLAQIVAHCALLPSSRASEQVGPVFCVNLAGLKTTIVSSRSAMKAVANAPESQLSARQAVGLDTRALSSFVFTCLFYMS
jgi:hypothetical protein